MVVLGIWAALIGYTVIYAGLCNYAGGGKVSLAQAFLGGGSCGCSSSAGLPGPSAAAPAAPAAPASGGQGGAAFPLWSPHTRFGRAR